MKSESEELRHYLRKGSESVSEEWDSISERAQKVEWRAETVSQKWKWRARPYPNVHNVPVRICRRLLGQVLIPQTCTRHSFLYEPLFSALIRS